MLSRRGSAKQKHMERLAWLAAHPDRMVGVPGLNEDVTEAGRASLEALRLTFLELGMFGSSPEAGQREAVRRLVSELRGEHVGAGQW